MLTDVKSAAVYRYVLDDAIYARIQTFAKARVRRDADLYAKRGQSDVSKIVKDIETGCAGEFVVYEHFRRIGRTVTEPDLALYSPGGKSWLDLTVDGRHLSVKSQSIEQAARYGLSWTFQWSIKPDPAFKDPDGRIALTLYDSRERAAYLLTVLDARGVLTDDILELPESVHLQANKRVIYWKTLVAHYDLC